jgi:hypothetical protein
MDADLSRTVEERIAPFTQIAFTWNTPVAPVLLKNVDQINDVVGPSSTVVTPRLPTVPPVPPMIVWLPPQPAPPPEAVVDEPLADAPLSAGVATEVSRQIATEEKLRSDAPAFTPWMSTQFAVRFGSNLAIRPPIDRLENPPPPATGAVPVGHATSTMGLTLPARTRELVVTYRNGPDRLTAAVAGSPAVIVAPTSTRTTRHFTGRTKNLLYAGRTHTACTSKTLSVTPF